jgi:hypothetical protein
MRKIGSYFGLVEPAGRSTPSLLAPSRRVLVLAIVLGGIVGLVVNYVGAGGTVGALLGAAVGVLVLYLVHWRRASPRS